MYLHLIKRYLNNSRREHIVHRGIGQEVQEVHFFVCIFLFVFVLFVHFKWSNKKNKKLNYFQWINETHFSNNK